MRIISILGVIISWPFSTTWIMHVPCNMLLQHSTWKPGRVNLTCLPETLRNGLTIRFGNVRRYTKDLLVGCSLIYKLESMHGLTPLLRDRQTQVSSIITWLNYFHFITFLMFYISIRLKEPYYACTLLRLNIYKSHTRNYYLFTFSQ